MKMTDEELEYCNNDVIVLEEALHNISVSEANKKMYKKGIVIMKMSLKTDIVILVSTIILAVLFGFALKDVSNYQYQIDWEEVMNDEG